MGRVQGGEMREEFRAQWTGWRSPVAYPGHIVGQWTTSVDVEYENGEEDVLHFYASAGAEKGCPEDVRELRKADALRTLYELLVRTKGEMIIEEARRSEKIKDYDFEDGDWHLRDAIENNRKNAARAYKESGGIYFIRLKTFGSTMVFGRVSQEEGK